MDLIGWDLGLYLKQIYQSNKAAIEWTNSPIVYRKTAEWELIGCAELIEAYFKPKVSILLYFCEGSHLFQVDENNGTVRYKSYLLILREILAVRFIKKHNKFPPMPFTDLVEDNLPPELKTSVTEILKLKAKNKEKKKGKRYADLDAFIIAELPELESYARALSFGKSQDIAPLNKIFYSTVITEKQSI